MSGKEFYDVFQIVQHTKDEQGFFTDKLKITKDPYKEEDWPYLILEGPPKVCAMALLANRMQFHKLDVTTGWACLFEVRISHEKPKGRYYIRYYFRQCFPLPEIVDKTIDIAFLEHLEELYAWAADQERIRDWESEGGAPYRPAPIPMDSIFQLALEKMGIETDYSTPISTIIEQAMAQSAEAMAQLQDIAMMAEVPSDEPT